MSSESMEEGETMEGNVERERGRGGGEEGGSKNRGRREEGSKDLPLCRRYLPYIILVEHFCLLLRQRKFLSWLDESFEACLAA